MSISLVPPGDAISDLPPERNIDNLGTWITIDELAYPSRTGRVDAGERTGHLTAFESEPFELLTFFASAVRIYQLGNNGVAGRRRRTWDACGSLTLRRG